MNITTIVHLVHNTQRDFQNCVHSLWQPYVVRVLYTSIQWVYKNAVVTRVVPMEQSNAMRISGMVLLVYKALQDFPNCVHSLW